MQSQILQNTDNTASYMVGDRLSDIETAMGVGYTPILVKTGHGEQHWTKVKKKASTRPSQYDPSLIVHETVWNNRRMLVVDDITKSVMLIKELHDSNGGENEL